MRIALLSLLAEAPRHGYELMQEIGERTGGRWQPSPGSVYPTLQQLEDEGLVRAEASDGRRVYHLTDEGGAEVERIRESRGDPWQALSERGAEPGRVRLEALVAQVVAASAQVARMGGETQQAKALEILAEARRQLYRVLGEGEPGEA